MLDLIDIARMEERRLAAAFCEMAAEVLEPSSGGVAARAAPGLWINAAVGLAMDGPITQDELLSIAEWYEGAGIEPRLEVCPYADPSLFEGLRTLNFSIRGFESVLFLDLAPPLPEPPSAPGGIQIRTLDPADADAVAEHARAVAPQFLPPGAPVTPETLEITARVVRHPRVTAISAWSEGRIVGGGCVEFYAEVATLCALAVVPEFRRRGVQTAIMHERLKLAQSRGARIATIGARPTADASGTERNARRAGFQVAYTKPILTRPGPGLAPVVG